MKVSVILLILLMVAAGSSFGASVSDGSLELNAITANRVQVDGNATVTQTVTGDKITDATGNAYMTNGFLYGDGQNITNTGAASATALTIAAKVNEGGGISKGQAVYLSGATGQLAQVSLLDNTNSAKLHFAGLAAETKANSQNIMVRVYGELVSTDTDGTGVPGIAESWSDGDELYAVTGGYLSNVEPTAGVIIHIGHVEYAHNTNGKLIIHRHQINGITVASGDDILLRMGDSAGANRIVFRDYANSQVGFIDSNGNQAISGGFVATSVTADVTAGNIHPTNIFAYTQQGPVNFNSQAMTAADINSGAIDNTAIGAGTPSTGVFTFITGNSFAFPASQVAHAGINVLDDYEEKYYTVTLVCSASGSYTVDANIDQFAYTKIGRVVHVQGYISITGETAPDGDLYISLPYTATALTENADFGIGMLRLQNHAGNTPNTYCQTAAGQSYAYLVAITDAGVASILNETDVDTAFAIYLNLTYIAEIGD